MEDMALSIQTRTVQRKVYTFLGNFPFCKPLLYLFGARPLEIVEVSLKLFPTQQATSSYIAAFSKGTAAVVRIVGDCASVLTGLAQDNFLPEPEQ